MALTAFLPTGAPQILPFIGTPGAGTVGYALVWSQSPQGFTLSPIAIGPDQFSGILPVASGGTGSDNGSITGTGALTFAAGGTNQNISLQPSGVGEVIFGSSALITPPPGPRNTGLVLQFPQNTSSVDQGFILRKTTPSGLGSFSFLNGSGSTTGFEPLIEAQSSVTSPSVFFLSRIPLSSSVDSRGVFCVSGRAQNGGLNFPLSTPLFSIARGNTVIFAVNSSGNLSAQGDSLFASITESTSATTGAVRVDGGLGVAKNLNIGGNLKVTGAAINFANLPTSSATLAVGDLWRDGELVKVKL